MRSIVNLNRKEFLLWFSILTISVIILGVIGMIFLDITYKDDVREISDRGRDTLIHLQYVLPRIKPDAAQEYIQSVYRDPKAFSYLLMMDRNGLAIAHSNPTRKGMNFYENGLKQVIATGKVIEQIYVRDADKPDSPYHGEKTIDILAPYYSLDGHLMGVINIGLSLENINQLQNKYLVAMLSGCALWLILIVVFAFMRFRLLMERKTAEIALAAEKELTQTRKNYETFFNTIDEFLFVLDDQGNIIHTNTTVTDRLGYKAEELLGQSVLMIHPPERRDEAGEIVGEMLSGVAEFCPVPIVTKSGVQIPVETRVAPGLWDGKPVIFGVTKDISQVKLSEEKFSKIFYINPSICGLSDLDTGKYIEVNEVFYTLLGFGKDEVIGKTAHELGIITTENARAILLKADANGNVTNAEADLKTKNGGIKHVLLSSENIYVQDKKYRFTIAHDITMRKEAEAVRIEFENQNRQLQKTESLSRMAAAIAHHFNNKLGAVIGNLELAQMEVSKGVQPQAHISAAKNASLNAAEMSRLMITYLGQSFDQCESLDLSDTCLRDMPLLQAVVSGNVLLETDLPLPGPVISANANQMQQVLTNLITNAREAAEEGGGSIFLGVKKVSSAEIIAKNRFPVDWQSQDNVYACLEVTDTGRGIDDKDIEKLFDPFYSTKFTGRGLGLAVVLGIVKTHKGVITVESEQGRGSTFRIFFPVSGEEVIRQPDKVVNIQPIEEGGTVLLVEDEEMLRDMAATMLESFGFSVLQAKDGVEALAVFGQHQSEIKFVLTDLTMPRMGGWETLAALRNLQPNIPVILSSGYDKARVMEGNHPELPHAFLGKPYNLAEMRDAIRQTLERK